MKTTPSQETQSSNPENLFSYKKPIENTWLKVCLKQLNKRKFKIWYTMLVHFYQEHDLFITPLSFRDLWLKIGARCHVKDQTSPNPYSGQIHNYTEHWKQNPYFFFDILSLSDLSVQFSRYCDDNVEILARIAEMLFLKDTRAAYEYVIQALNLPENSEESIDDLVLQIEEHVARYI